jgi:predicted Zn-ribbon and HTH transcriptional regulator
MTWTEEATAVLNTAPDGVRGIARTTIHRWAMERGHSVITRKVIENSMASILPEKAMRAMGIIAEEVAIDKGNLLESLTYICRECGYAARDVEPVVCPICNGPAEGFQKIDKQAIENLTSLEGGIEEETTFDNLKLKWTSEAKQALLGVPSGYQRRRARAQIEKSVRVRKLPAITRELVLEVSGDLIEETKNLEERGRLKEESVSGTESALEQHVIEDGDFRWTAAAVARLNRVPEGFMRDQTKERITNCGKERSVDLITLEIAEEGIAESREVMAEAIRKNNEEESR